MPWIIEKNMKYLNLRFPVNHWVEDLGDATTFKDKIEADCLAAGYDVEPTEIIMEKKEK